MICIPPLATGAPAMNDSASEPLDLSLTVNGRPCRVRVDPAATLVEVLRDELGLTGTKIGCDRGACSACTVWLDGEVIASCMTFALDARGRQVTTIEGLAQGEQLHPVQQAFVEHDALQCGFCTPGHGDELRRISWSAIRTARSTTCAARSAVICAAAAPTRTSSRRRWPLRRPCASARTAGARHERLGPTRRAQRSDGIVGDELQPVTRNVPVDEPPQLPPNAELRVIGKRVDRVDAVPKVTGQARYTYRRATARHAVRTHRQQHRAARAHQVDRHFGRGGYPGVKRRAHSRSRDVDRAAARPFASKRTSVIRSCATTASRLLAVAASEHAGSEGSREARARRVRAAAARHVAGGSDAAGRAGRIPRADGASRRLRAAAARPGAAAGWQSARPIAQRPRRRTTRRCAAGLRASRSRR